MKKILLVPILCMAMFLPGIKTLAADPLLYKYCPQCGANLTWGAGQTSHYTNVHYVDTNLVDSNKNPIYEKCTVSYEDTPVSRICPNGHGAVWSGTCHDERHSSSRCSNIREYR